MTKPGHVHWVKTTLSCPQQVTFWSKSKRKLHFENLRVGDKDLLLDDMVFFNNISSFCSDQPHPSA